jgi:hypothetical protein
MQTDYDLGLRAAVQIALLGQITRSIRAISFEVEPERHLVRLRFHFDGNQHEIELENMSAVVTEVMAGFPWGWDVIDEYLTCKEPEKPEWLRLIGYVRCESTDFLPPP